MKETWQILAGFWVALTVEIRNIRFIDPFCVEG
jgi:hypothetical protein